MAGPGEFGGSAFDDRPLVHIDDAYRAPAVLLPDDFLIVGKNALDTGPIVVDVDGYGEDDADTVDDVIVTGVRKPPSVSPPVEVPLPDPGSGGDSGGGGGGEGQPPPPPPADLHDACEDRRADTLADEVNDEMQRQPDLARREYGALIWRDDAGNLHRTGLVPGTNGRVDFPANSNELGIDNYNRVVAMVHSHPSQVYLEATGQWVAASSGGIHGGDWSAADGWIRDNNLSLNNFSMYVTYQGTVREYDSRDNTNPALRSAQDSTGSQESGDYNPGATCP